MRLMADDTWLREMLSEVREPCEEDNGRLRKCCGTAQLGPHHPACPLSGSMRDAMLDHERMYSHETEVQA